MLRYLNMFVNGEVTNLQNMGQAAKADLFSFLQLSQCEWFCCKKGEDRDEKSKCL